MDEELKKLIGTEVSEEFLNENKIETIEQYRNFVQNDSTNEKNKKNKYKKYNKKEAAISSTKEKQMKRRNETLLNKKIKNQQREKILQSLQNHNNQEERKIVDLLESSKNLGKKRKMSNDKNIKRIAKEEELETEENEKNSLSSDFSDSDLDEETRRNKLNLSLNEMYSKNDSLNKLTEKAEISSNDNNNKGNLINSKLNLMDISSEEKNKILFEIKQYRLREEEIEKLEELRNNFVNGDFGEETMMTDLEIPEKSHIKLIERKPQIQSERLSLPIVKYEQEIMDQINHNLCTVVCGETGSGKSTQIPQFLYEYGYTSSFGAIAITQPRRVAAISLASRVAIEMNCKLADEVGYQIRYDSYHFSEKTVIKYLTDGILLRELESDGFLLKYSVVIIDEAHERTINTDIIIGLLSQAVKLRYLMSKNNIKINEKEVKPLRIVIMSATMRVDEFLESNVFNPKPAFIKVESRRFPVTVHHLKRTEMDYLDQAYKMTCKIHRKLPPGAVLVFLTGKQEILKLCEMLRKEFEENPEVINAGEKGVNENNSQTNLDQNENINKEIEEKEIFEKKINLKQQSYLNTNLSNNQENNHNTGLIKNEIETNNQTVTAIEEDKNDISDEKIQQNVEKIEVLNDEINKCEKRPEDLIIENDELENNDTNAQKDKNSEIDLEEENKVKFTYKPAIVLPLFSSLTKEQQMKIFQKLDPNARLIVVSTNIAETSLTIPNIRYVVDSGKAKKRIFKAGLSFSSFKVEWISQASAEQRTGRAGRTCAGFCYRLYSNGLYSKMEKFTEPQIVSSPLDQTILYLKSLDVRDINKFPFLTKPQKEFVDKALRHLLLIGALDSKSKNLIKAKLAENELNKLGKSNEDQIKYDDDTDITEVGKLMIKFPVIPRLARILILSNKLNMLTYGLILSSLLSIESIFDSELKYEKFNKLNDEKDDLLQEELENEFNTHKKPEKKKPKSIRDILDEKLISPNSDPITLMNLILYFFISFDNNIEKQYQVKNSQKQIINTNNKQTENNFFQYKMNKEINNVIDLFCEKFCLNNKKFKEMLDLLEQLIRISSQIFKKDANEINLKRAKIPTKEEQITLSQILLSGYLDNIARKKIIYDKLSNEKEVTTQKRLIYESNENNEEIHIHPFSVAFRSNLKSANVGNNLASPEYVLYKEIIKENKIFMNINTIIRPEWLYDIGGDLVKYSLNLSNMLSEPYYDKNNDAIYCYINLKYGYKSWEIPNVLVEMRNTDDNYFRYFAKLLLEGKIFESLKNFQKFFVQKPSILTKQVSILPCVTMLLNELRINNIFSKQDIFNKWKNNKKFLLESMLKWISDDKAKKELIKIWPLQN